MLLLFKSFFWLFNGRINQLKKSFVAQYKYTIQQKVIFHYQGTIAKYHKPISNSSFK